MRAVGRKNESLVSSFFRNVVPSGYPGVHLPSIVRWALAEHLIRRGEISGSSTPSKCKNGIFGYSISVLSDILTSE